MTPARNRYVIMILILMLLTGSLFASALYARQTLDLQRIAVNWLCRNTTWFVTNNQGIGIITASQSADVRELATQSGAAAGPLRVLTSNPRYFTDGTGEAILLTGSHTWSNFQDNGSSSPPPKFDYSAYLDFLEENNHNFFRFWVWEQSRWTNETADDNYWFSPMPFLRTGPGIALDGKLKFDLTKFDQSYFDRMRSRIIEAGDRGIYVSIMLFNGWSINFYDWAGNPWDGHPFHVNNNINGIDGDLNKDDSGGETHELSNENLLEIQEAYVRRVIDTVNDLDNVLYEISNESNGESTIIDPKSWTTC